MAPPSPSRPTSAAGCPAGAGHAAVVAVAAARPSSAAGGGGGGGLAERRKKQNLRLSLSDSSLVRPSSSAGLGRPGGPNPFGGSSVWSPGTNAASPTKDAGGSRPSTASPTRSGRFTAEEKACFRRVPTPSSTCDEKSKSYFQTTGKLRQCMSEKGLSCFPVDKGEFYNHPLLGSRQEQRKMLSRNSRTRSSSRTNRSLAARRSGIFGCGTGPPPLPVESLAAEVLEEILPVSPACKDMTSSCSTAAAPMKDAKSAVPQELLEYALVTPSPTMPLSPTATVTVTRTPSGRMPVQGTGVQRFEWLRAFRAAILAKYSTIVQAYSLFSRDVDPERDLTKPEWRRLLMKRGFPEFAGRKEVNQLFVELDLSGDNQVSLKEWYIAMEMAAPVRSLEALRRRWLSTGYKSMTQAMRAMDQDDNVVCARRLELADFGALLSLTEVVDEDEHRALFFAVCGDTQATTSLEELHCAIAAVSPSLMLEDFRDRLNKRFKGDFRRAFYYLDKDNGGTLGFKEFANVAVNRFDLTSAEAEKMFRAIDLDGSGEITSDEFQMAMRLAEPSLFYEELRFKVRQRYHSIRDALNNAFADEVTDGLQMACKLSKARFAEALVPLGLLESEVTHLFELIDENGDGELVAAEFMEGVRRFAPACVLEDLRVRACQVYSNTRDAFDGISTRRWTELLPSRAFHKKMIAMRLAEMSRDEIDVMAIFDLLDVNCEGHVTIGRLFAALCSCGAGSHPRLPSEELDIKALETVHGDVAPVQRHLWDFRKEIRCGTDFEGPLTTNSATRRTPLSAASGLTTTRGLAGEASAAAATAAEGGGGGGSAARLGSDGRVPAPRLQTVGQDGLEPWLKAVPALAADCTCSAEVAVFDTKDSFRKAWGHLQDVPRSLATSGDTTRNLVEYYQSAVTRLSRDAPLHHKVESRMETFVSQRIAEGGLRSGSQGGPRPAAGGASCPRPSSQGCSRQSRGGSLRR